MLPMPRHAAALLMAAASLLSACCSVVAKEDVCQTSECLALSAFITSSMNMSADPCEDFDAYACGNYRVNTLYDPASVTWSRNGDLVLSVRGLDAVRKKLSKLVFELLLFPPSPSSENSSVLNAMNQLSSRLFRSCISWAQRKRTAGRYSEENEKQLSGLVINGILEHLIEGFGPRSQSVWFERALAKLVRFGFWPLLEILASTDFMYRRGNVLQNMTRVRLSYERSKLDFTDPIVYNLTAFLGTVPAASSLNFADLGDLVAIDMEVKKFVLENSSDSTKIQRWRNCSASKSLTERGNFAAEVAIRDLNELSKCLDQKDPFDWSTFFDAVLDGSVDKGERIQFGTRGKAIDIISMVSYFKRRSISGSKDSKFTAHFSYLVLDWLSQLSFLYPKPLAAAFAQRFPTRSNFLPIEPEAPIEDCMLLTKRLLSPVVERLFQRSHHDKNFDHVTRLINAVQTAIAESVRGQTWITPSSKLAIIDKIMSLKKNIGFETIPDTKLIEFYASTARTLNVAKSQVSYKDFGLLLSHGMCALAGRRNNLLSDSASVVQSAFIFMDSLTVNAFSALTKNAIIFPMGILSPTIYHRSYPNYINLGGIGVVIGHEIGHGFDDMGHELNKQGIRGHFWDNQTEAGYIERMKCVTSRFASYEIVPGEQHKSSMTVGNDISDLMGIKAGFEALKLMSGPGKTMRLPNLPESLTPEKLFFIHAAQTWCDKTEASSLVEIYKNSKHSPSHIRIRGMMENSRDFAATFQCRPGQAMNPRNKCEFW